LNKLEWLEHEVPRAVEKAPEEFAEMEAMKKMRAVAQSVKAGNEMKTLVKQLVGDVQMMKKDITEIKEAMETLKTEMDNGKMAEHGDACKAANLNEIKDCYEKAYGKIPPSTKQKAGGDSCCTIF